MNIRKNFYALSMIALSIFAVSCENEEPDSNNGGTQTSEKITGMFVLNEGTFGAGNSTLSFINFTGNTLYKDIYGKANPSVAGNLGDAGNCIAINDGKIYILTSNFVEIINESTCKQIKRIDINSPRDIKFHNGNAYISSYGVMKDEANYKGIVYKFDTSSLEITGEVTVGYQPEEMAINGNKLYVANSVSPDYTTYDKNVSVINLDTYTFEKNIEVEVNLHRMEIDGNGNIYVSSRGNYSDISSNLFVIDTKTDAVVDTLGIPVSDMCLSGNKIYVTSAQWSYAIGGNEISYSLYDIAQHKIIPEGFITDGSDKEIKLPYGIEVNPENNDIYVTDAIDSYVPQNGTIYCFGADGRKKWTVEGEIMPAHIAFTEMNVEISK